MLLYCSSLRQSGRNDGHAGNIGCSPKAHKFCLGFNCGRVTVVLEVASTALCLRLSRMLKPSQMRTADRQNAEHRSGKVCNV